MRIKQPILITGVERSGSSLIAKICHLAGAFSGEVSSMYENNQIKKLVGDYLFSMKGDPLGQYPLPDTTNLLIPTGWKDSVESILIQEGLKEGQIWFYKSFRISLMWPVWSVIYPNAKWVIVRRRSGDIVESCLKTAFMRAYKDPTIQQEIGVSNEQDGWLWWIHQYETRFVDMIQAGLNCKVVWPDRMVGGDYQQIFELLEWLGLPWSGSIVTTIDPLLRKSKHKINENNCCGSTKDNG